MKKLLVNAGIAAATSIAFTALTPQPQAQALDLTATTLDTLSFGSSNGVDDPFLRNYPIEVAVDEPGVIEVGEIAFNEIRGYVEYDISTFADLENLEDTTFNIGFNIFEENGSGAAGVTGTGDNSETYYEGILSAYWYVGSNFPYPDESVFNVDEFPIFNALGQFDLSSHSAGDRLSFDSATITQIVNGLLDPANGLEQYFGIMFVAEEFRQYDSDGNFIGSNGGECGPGGSLRSQCSGVLLNNFGISAVPTPAAILPTLLGMASAALRKKQGQE